MSNNESHYVYPVTREALSSTHAIHVEIRTMLTLHMMFIRTISNRPKRPRINLTTHQQQKHRRPSLPLFRSHLEIRFYRSIASERYFLRSAHRYIYICTDELYALCRETHKPHMIRVSLHPNTQVRPVLQKTTPICVQDQVSRRRY